jgi:hypothetical protein
MIRALSPFSRRFKNSEKEITTNKDGEFRVFECSRGSSMNRQSFVSQEQRNLS